MNAKDARKLVNDLFNTDNSQQILRWVEGAAQQGKSSIEVESSLMTNVTKETLISLGYRVFGSVRNQNSLGRHEYCYFVTW